MPRKAWSPFCVKKQGRELMSVEKIRGVYNSLNKIIVPVSWIFIGVALGFDFCPLPYINPWMEDLFTYDVGGVLSITLVIWTFITVLFVYYLEHMNERCYGVRLIDVLQFNKNYKEFEKKILLFIGELLLLIAGAILELSIMIAALTLLQFVFMIYTATLICYYTSKAKVLEVIEQEFRWMLSQLSGENREEDIRKICQSRLVIQMIHKMDYSNEEDVDKLLELLSIGSEVLTSSDNRKKHRYMVNYFTQLILKADGKREDGFIVIQNWFLKNNTCIEYKEEILMALVESGTRIDIMDCKELCSTQNDDVRKYLLECCITYNNDLQQYKSEEYRRWYNKSLREAFEGFSIENKTFPVSSGNNL